VSRSRPTRVLFVINGLNRGGAETQLLRIAREVKAHGHEVALAVLNPENDFGPELAQLGVPLWAPDPEVGRWNVRHLLRLARELKRWQPDVTVTFLFQATLFMRGLNLWLRPGRAISSMRNDQLENRLRSVIYRASCAADDTIVVNSRAAAAKLQQLGTIPRSDKVTVIYNGIDADRVRASVSSQALATRRALDLADDEVLLLGVGRMRPQKDWPALLRAVAAAGRPDLRCLVAGDGDLLDSLVELSRELGVDQQVRFLGLRDDVPDLMAAADCLVMSSRYEGTPNVVLEALALDLPVISTDVGACAELLTRPEDTIVPPDDDAALAEALRRVVRRDPTRPSAAPAPGADGMAAFAWPRIGQQWTDLITGKPGA
jgi:glycosyltransferase involved in cell wall biosynthesis